MPSCINQWPRTAPANNGSQLTASSKKRLPPKVATGYMEERSALFRSGYIATDTRIVAT